MGLILVRLTTYVKTSYIYRMSLSGPVLDTYSRYDKCKKRQLLLHGTKWCQDIFSLNIPNMFSDLGSSSTLVLC